MSMKNPTSIVGGLLLLLAGCASLDSTAELDAVPEIRPGILAGFLPREELPDSLDFVPPAPAEGSAALALDERVHRDMQALRGSARWELAQQDADLSFPAAAGTFSCALGAPISEEHTPHLYVLMRRTLVDAGLSTYAAKDHYQRKRPFMVHGETTCVPDSEEGLREDGSYPSGHSAIGWGWALVLAELAPDRLEQLMARGREFGQSRVVCNVHWQNDVIEGRMVAAAAVARLHDDPTFLSEMKLAASELEAVRKKGLPPARDCESEAEALSSAR
jgi:acid phosphatase (class A)